MNTSTSTSPEDSSPLPVNLPIHRDEDEDEGPEYWQSHLDRWVRSGLSQASYCRRHDLSYKKFRKWKDRLITYPKHSSIKLVEVKRDFAFNASPQFQSPFFGSWCSGDHSYGPNIPPELNRVGNRQPSSASSGIRFWCGPFCIEIDVQFSSESLSQLIRTLQRFQGLPVTNTVDTGNAENAQNAQNAQNAENAENAENE